MVGSHGIPGGQQTEQESVTCPHSDAGWAALSEPREVGNLIAVFPHPKRGCRLERAQEQRGKSDCSKKKSCWR